LELVGYSGGGQNEYSHPNGTATDSFIVTLSIPLAILLLGGLIVAVYFYRLNIKKVSP